MKKISSFILVITFLCFSMICIGMASMSVNAEVITDVTGPTITEAYCDKLGQVLKPGDTAYFSFKAYDESGLSDGVSVNFYEATSYKGRSFDWIYNSAEDKYETTFTVPSSAKNGETGYTVYYSTKKDSGFTKYGNFKADTKTCSITGLTSGKTYYFKVRTYIKTDSGYVYSAWSAVKSVKVK